MVQLPSGLVFRVTFAADPARPWRVVTSGGYWRVSRERREGGVAYFYGGRTAPMKLSLTDAEAVAEVLNRATHSPRLLHLTASMRVVRTHLRRHVSIDVARDLIKRAAFDMQAGPLAPETERLVARLEKATGCSIDELARHAEGWPV
jgi:hypothetical protein